MYLFLLLIAYPFYCYALGASILSFCSTPIRRHLPARYLVLLGLIVSNYLLLGIKNCGATWAWSCLVIWGLPSIFLFLKYKKYFFIKIKLSNGFLYFALFNLIIGISLFDLDHGIRTYWISNFGDLAYHLGMITSFVFGDNFPPQYHLYPEQKLTYPFLINFWTASFWWISPEWRALEFIFVYQWCFLTTLLYRFLRGDRNKFFPWLVLLGGGLYFKFTEPASVLIDQGYPWTGFLETIWIPQRSALFGAVCLFAGLSTWLRIYQKPVAHPHLWFFGALLIALMPLVHTHSWIISFSFCCFLILLMFWRSSQRLNFLKQNYQAMLIIVSSLWALIYLSDKNSAVNFTWGWEMTAVGSPITRSWLMQQLLFWLLNTWNIILIFLVLAWKMKSKIIPIFILGLFLFGNFVKLSYWSYDQIKIFLPIYLVILLCWHSFISQKSKLNYLLIILLIPGIVRVGYLVINQGHHEVYTASQLIESKRLRDLLPREAIVAAEPLHNSTITLTGRKLYLGFLGTLWTHGIKYQERETVQKNLLINDCQSTICPEFIYQPTGMKYWEEQALLNRGFEAKGSGLFRITD